MKHIERDKGYSWTILCVCFTNNMLASVPFLVPGIYMIEWQEEFETNKSSVAIVVSISNSLACLTALFLGPIISKYGGLPVTLVGATLSTIGGILSFFALNIWWLYITYGVLIGIGSGMTFFPPYVYIQYYFDKKRAFAAGIAVAGRSLGGILSLPCIQFLCSEFGWRGAILIQTGISMNFFAIALFFQKPNLPELQSSNTSSNQQTDSQKDQQDNKKTSKLRKYFSVLMDPIYLRFLIAVLLSIFVVDYMFKFTPLKAVSMGISKRNAAYLPAIGSLVAFIVRFPVSVIANLKWVNRTILLGVSFLLEGSMCILCTLAVTFPGYAVFMAFFATFYSITTTIETTTMVDLVGIKNLAQGQAFNLGGTGLVFIISLSLAGVIADNTDNLSITNYIYGGLCVISGLLVLSILLTNRFYLTRTAKSKELNSNHLNDKFADVSMTEVEKVSLKEQR